MSYTDFKRKIEYLKNLDISTNDEDLKRELERLIKREIYLLCNQYYNK